MSRYFWHGADLTVGDPWLPRYVQNEKKGVSICIPHTQRALSLLDEMLDCGRFEKKEIVSSGEVLESQKGTLEKKAVYLAHPGWISLLRALYRQPLYRKWIFKRYIPHASSVSS